MHFNGSGGTRCKALYKRNWPFLVLSIHLDRSNYLGPWDRSWSIGSFWKPGTASFLGVPKSTAIFACSRILPRLLGEVY